jgi:hypothetical protein
MRRNVVVVLPGLMLAMLLGHAGELHRKHIAAQNF